MRNLTLHCGVPPENLIWAPMHSSNLSMIPEKWHERQRPADILAYNAATSAAARAAGLGVFDMYNLTMGVRTLDGTHLDAPSTQLKSMRCSAGWMRNLLVRCRHPGPRARSTAAC